MAENITFDSNTNSKRYCCQIAARESDRCLIKALISSVLLPNSCGRYQRIFRRRRASSQLQIWFIFS